MAIYVKITTFNRGGKCIKYCCIWYIYHVRRRKRVGVLCFFQCCVLCNDVISATWGGGGQNRRESVVIYTAKRGGRPKNPRPIFLEYPYIPTTVIKITATIHFRKVHTKYHNSLDKKG